ncbi:MAG: thioredoxin family protein [Bacteroidetes bacterium]|nr:thioredoxin family protein [Bacteroidota bacterium]
MNLLKTCSWPLATVFLVCALSINAQQIRYDRVDFQDNPEWPKVMDEARQSGKIIFLDGYTVWCGPCKKMEKEVFTRPEVANFFNQKFINVKYDMEQPGGVGVKNQYDVKVFPTYLFINANGQEVHRIVGAHTQENTFLDWSKMAVTPGRSCADLEQRYRNGERNPVMMFDYMLALRMAGEQKKETEITTNYLSLMGKDHFMDRTYWGAAKLFLKMPTSREFRILLNNREEIGAVIGQQEVDDKIYETIDAQIRENISFVPYEGNSFDKVAEEDLIIMLREGEFPKRNELLARALAAHYIRAGDWYDLAYMVDAALDFRLLDGYREYRKDLDFYAVAISKVALDEALLHKALRWSEHNCEYEPKPSERAVFLTTKAMLLEKLGRTAEAKEAKSEAAAAARM